MPSGIGYGIGYGSRFRELLKGRQKPSNREKISRQFQGQAKEDQARGSKNEAVAGERLRNFDAEETAARVGRAQYDTFSRDLGRSIEDLRGSQVGRGRLQSGFGFDDEDRLFQGALEDFNRQLVQNSFTASGQNLQATGQLGELGGRQTGRYLDVLASERDADFLEEERRRKAAAEKRGGIFGALKTIAKGGLGFAAGGPAGAAAALAV